MPRVRDTVLLSGWLFADLMLGLAIIFLANSSGIRPPPPPTPTPTPIAIVSPTPTPRPTPVPGRVLESNYCRIVLNDNNPDTFSNDLGFAEQTLEPQINAIGFLKGRKVGTAIAYGGVDNSLDPNDQARGVAMSNNVYGVLRDLGNKTPRGPFGGTSYYDSLFTGKAGFTSQNVVIDVYLVERQGSNANTCDSNHNLV